MWTPSTFSQSAGVRPMATHSSTPSNPLVHDPSCPIKVDPNDLWMMATDTQMSLFFSWKGEEDCCGAAWETVSTRGWMRPLIGLNFKSNKNPKNSITPNFCHSAAELHPNHRHLMRSSSRWPASQRQVSGLFQVWKDPRCDTSCLLTDVCMWLRRTRERQILLP